MNINTGTHRRNKNPAEEKQLSSTSAQTYEAPNLSLPVKVWRRQMRRKTRFMGEIHFKDRSSTGQSTLIPLQAVVKHFPLAEGNELKVEEWHRIQQFSKGKSKAV